ncbi:Uncharacterised protein [Streptococcus pneumoniae]|nr:Uncharacterised protein [Streptococcus pneumoniae]
MLLNSYSTMISMKMKKLITINMSIWNVSDLSVLLKIFHFSWRLLLMMLKMMMRKVKSTQK